MTSVEEVLAWSAAIVGVGAALAVLWKLGRTLWGLVRDGQTFFMDWNGTPARPGVCAVPGVMARLDAQDVQQEQVIARVARIEWHTGNGNPIPLRHVVDGHTQAIDDILGVLGSRKRDTLANYLPPKKVPVAKAKVKS